MVMVLVIVIIVVTNTLILHDRIIAIVTLTMILP